MNCECPVELLSLYAEGEVGAEERLQVEAHLLTCPSCAELLSALRETSASLRAIPELEVSRELLSRLYAIPEKKKRFSFSLDFLLRPSLQPVLTVATIFLILVSVYFFNPNKKQFDRVVDRQLHLGYGTVEKIYAKAGSVTDSLGSYKDTFLGSLKKLKFWEKPKD